MSFSFHVAYHFGICFHLPLLLMRLTLLHDMFLLGHQDCWLVDLMSFNLPNLHMCLVHVSVCIAYNTSCLVHLV